jgi:hypothetical protein
LWNCREEISNNYKKQSFIPRRDEILEIQQKKDRLEEPPLNQGLKVIPGQHATKKGNFYTNKPLDILTWTLDEGEEIRRDINDLQNKTVTKDELQGMMDCLKRDIIEGLKNFLIERKTESENVSHEIHDEDTRKMNQ